MIIISLDEQGDFEKLSGEKVHGTPAFIGGILYDDKEIPGDFENEKQRINRYLKCVCAQAGAVYPKDLHVDNLLSNHKIVKAVKTKLSETLGQFFQKGSLPEDGGSLVQSLNRMEERKGEYHIFALLNSGIGKRELQKRTTSELVRESFASNLYVHMAEEIVERLIFHNPLIDVERVRLDLATRRVVLEGEDCRKKAEEYIRLGYKEDLDPAHKMSGRRIFLLTNADNYRTAIEREMLNSEQHKIHIDRIGVKSIYYGHETENYRMEFLYLADIICSVIGFRLDTSSPQALVSDFKERADRLIGHAKNLIFTYDPIDIYFKKAWRKLEEKDYYEALSIAYDGMESDSTFSGYYRTVWFSKLEAKILKEEDAIAYGVAIKKLYDSARTNNLRQDKLLYIFNCLERMERNMKFKNEEEKAELYSLYDTGVSAYCHVGDSQKAEFYFGKCKQHAKFIGLERYLATLNKVVVFLCDWFQYKKALDLAQEDVLYHDELLEMKKMVFGEEIQESAERSKALSQLGQVYAYLRDAEAESVFLKALEGLGERYTPDFLQTESYLLHYYIEMGEKEKYDERARMYFGNQSNLRKQLQYIFSEGSKTNPIFSMKFALYVYIKGIYSFHLDDIGESLLEKLCNIEDTLKQAGNITLRERNGHPWEIIYKYLALIALKKGRLNDAERNIQNANNILQYRGITLDLICWFGTMEYTYQKGDWEAIEKMLEAPPRSLEETNALRHKLAQQENAKMKYEYLQSQVMTYMYH